MYPHYSPPPVWATYAYPNTPPPQFASYTPQFGSPYTSRRHNRKASYSARESERPRHSAFQPAYDQDYQDYQDYFFAQQRPDPVSATSRRRPSFRHGARARSQIRHIFPDVDDDEYLPPDHHGHARSPMAPKYGAPRTPAYRTSDPTDSHFFSSQASKRRQSTSTRTPKFHQATAAAKPSCVATQDDADRAGIPPGYSIKHWDPTEVPITLLGSVFDANSLGKWIFDWTVFHYGPSTPMADVAGDLWLLLIKLSGKTKRAGECVRRIKLIEDQEVVNDFLESGERLSAKFKKLLVSCEKYMWGAAKRDDAGSYKMGRNAGCEFVETMFGRDRKLEKTERLMNSIRVWNMRFDANCEEILRRRPRA